MLQRIIFSSLLFLAAATPVVPAFSAPSWVKIGTGTPATCSTGYIPVSASTLPGGIAVPAFCVMKYEAKKSNVALGNRDIGGSMGTYPVSVPTNLPWVGLTWQDARSACATAGAQLISENQWLSLAHQASLVASNWTGGTYGSGFLFVGHSDGTPAAFLAASALDTDGYSGTGNTSGYQRRTLTLSNGQVIWDLAGNAQEWVDQFISVANAYHPGTGAVYSYSSGDGTLAVATNMPLEKRPPSSYNANQGMGRFFAGTTLQKAENNYLEAPDFCTSACSQVYAFVRGGNRIDTYTAGVFALGFGLGRSAVGGYVYATPGFRCTK